MTLQELYALIEGDYEAATRVLRIEKLIDKHIRKLPANPIFPDLFRAWEDRDEKAVFEAAHAVKGVCSNLGLPKMAALSSDVCEEFRAGNQRRYSDAQLGEIIEEIKRLFSKASDGIARYESEIQP